MADEYLALVDYHALQQSERPPPAPRSDTCLHFSQPHAVEPQGAGPGRLLYDTTPPAWTSPEAVNFRGHLPHTSRQYVGTVQVNVGGASFVADALFDTAGTSSVMDMQSAQRLGLPLQYATPSLSLGTCKGIGDGSIPYAACVEGPVEFQFAPDVSLTTSKIYVLDVNHRVFLVGADVLQHRSTGAWSFLNIGNDA